MSTILTFDDIEKIIILNRSGNGEVDFGPSTCCDYVDSLLTDDNRFGVTVFVEPGGDITKWGESFAWVLDWWIKVFQAQPTVWDYVDAGWYLMGLFEADNLNDDPGKVWPAEPKPSEFKPELAKATEVFSRVGVSFSPEQQERVRTLREAGDTAGAQGVILDRLSEEA